MTRRRVTLVLAFVVASAVVTVSLIHRSKPDPECDSCSARHKDKVRLHEFLKSKNSEAE